MDEDSENSGCGLSAVLGFLKSRDVEQDVLDAFTREKKYFEVHKLTQARIYLTSKKISTTSSSNENRVSEIEEDFTQAGVGQRQEDHGKQWRQEYASIKKENEVKENRLRQELEDVKRLEGLRRRERVGYHRNQQWIPIHND
ncbi:hypothetical protein OS493_011098 [Desmophyllum pertusum]|uniref:Uncharacterized protein n=1 Tax=Desmophyllum pertusum TaxID=174260 RepID=A0A9W9Z1L1_9CNID|nr:hypothetical protein OS493_011098 [Desmophyllum pertusum]